MGAIHATQQEYNSKINANIQAIQIHFCSTGTSLSLAFSSLLALISYSVQ
jgi:hypothetical protein